MSNQLTLDLNDFGKDVEKEIHNVFEGIVEGVSYAEKTITEVLDVVESTEVILNVLDPAAAAYLEIFVLILQSLQSIGDHVSATSDLIAKTVTPGASVSTQQVQAISTSTQTTVSVIGAAATAITNKLKNKDIIHKAYNTAPKNVHISM